MEIQEANEAFYDYLDQTAMRLYEADKTPYLEGLSLALSFLLDDTFSKAITPSVQTDITAYKEAILHQSFSKESVRKAIQLSLLKGFKHMEITNSMMTPDSIGMFVAYLLKKLYNNQKDLTVLDPLNGTGNLCATLHNHYADSLKFTGLDADPLLCHIARNFFDALEMKHEVFHQDTLTYEGPKVDLIVTDFPIETQNRKHSYFPYEVILHHQAFLKPYGFFLAIIENDFFDQKEAPGFKKRLLENMHLYGLIKFDEGLFKNHPQSLLIMQKKHEASETIDDFLLADLPPFTEQKAFQRTLNQIEDWFLKRKVDEQ